MPILLVTKGAPGSLVPEMRMFSTRTATNAVPRILAVAALAAAVVWIDGCERQSKGVTRGPAVPVAATAGSVRLVCWNIEWFPGKSNNTTPDKESRHIEEIRAALTAMQPDILLAQEVSSSGPLLEALSGVAGHQLGVISRFSGRQQMATTSRIPIEAGWFERWERDGRDDPPRGFSHVSFRLPDGRLLLTYNLHLKSNAGGDPASNRAKREDSIRQLMAHIKSELPKYREQTSPAIVIAGDFNTNPDSSQFAGERTIPMLVEAGFKSAFDGLPESQRITWPSDGRFPDTTFDYVFYKGLEVERVQVPSAYDGYSDHRPVVVDFR